MILASQSGGVYDYEFEIGANDYLNFDAGQQVLLTGLSGVTGVSLESPFSDCFSSAFTGSTVTLTATTAGGACGFSGALNVIETTFGTLVVDTSGATPGGVDFDVQGTDFDTGDALGDGTVEGPVAAIAPTPEPSSLLLLGTGLFGVLAALRRRRITPGDRAA